MSRENPLRVAKLGYSRNPWRIVDSDGQELWRDERFDHPMLGPTVISMPACFPRKRDAVAWLAAHDPFTEPTPDSNGEPPPIPDPGEPEVSR